MSLSPQTPARVLVIGAGAIGGLLAARLALAGHEVSVVARGAHLAAMQARRHLVLETQTGTQCAAVQAFGQIAAAPPADFVLITLKAWQLPPLAAELGDRARRARVCVTIQNGIPWWYFQGHGGPHAGRVVRAVDPDGALRQHLDKAPLVPGFASMAAEVISPGHVKAPVSAADAVPLGPLDEQSAAAAEQAALASALFTSAGYLAPRVNVRQAAWAKLLGNLWTNPVGALTRSTIAHLATHPAGLDLARALMHEAENVARAFDIDPGLDYEQRFERSRTLRQGIKSSMQQDIERGRPTERAAILDALIELANLVQVAVPRTQTLAACLQLLEENLTKTPLPAATAPPATATTQTVA